MITKFEMKPEQSTFDIRHSAFRYSHTPILRHLFHSDTPILPYSDTSSSSSFTLIELLVALTLVTIAMAIIFTTFYSVSRAWQRGLAMADNLNHGEYVMEQLVNGLRSTFFPSAGSDVGTGEYGFWLEDNGSDEQARDTISWVKTGVSLLRMDDPLSQGLHRVQVSVENDEDDRLSVAIRAWRPFASIDTWKPGELAPFFISGKIVGISFRVSTNCTDQGWEWEEKWEDEATNHVPHAVEVTLYMNALEENERPVEIKRLVEIPIAPLSWTR